MNHIVKPMLRHGVADESGEALTLFQGLAIKPLTRRLVTNLVRELPREPALRSLPSTGGRFGFLSTCSRSSRKR